MLNITDLAQKYLSNLLVNKKSGTQIYMFIINPGTTRAECGLSFYLPKDNANENEMYTILKFDKFMVYLNKRDIPFLRGAKIDLISDEFNNRLLIEAPNIKVSYSDSNITENDTSLVTRIRYLLETKINPVLSVHNGSVSLITVSDSYAILEFSGGCNGCAMIDTTIKEYIEKELISYFPELKGVRDATLHNQSEHSFF